jgi:hypothetical protein
MFLWFVCVYVCDSENIKYSCTLETVVAID